MCWSNINTYNIQSVAFAPCPLFVQGDFNAQSFWALAPVKRHGIFGICCKLNNVNFLAFLLMTLYWLLIEILSAADWKVLHQQGGEDAVWARLQGIRSKFEIIFYTWKITIGHINCNSKLNWKMRNPFLFVILRGSSYLSSVPILKINM